MSKGTTCLAALIAGFLLVAGLSGGRDREPNGVVRLRQPMALVIGDEGRRLFVANRRAGTVSALDVERRRVLAEIEVGPLLADMTDDGAGRLLVVAEKSGELAVLDRRTDELRVRGRVHVGAAPVSVRRLAAGRAVVACLWPRQLVFVAVAKMDHPRIEKTIRLPFAPRGVLVLPGGEKIVVADAFGGRLAVVDAQRGIVDSVRAVPGHNLRGLAVSADGKELLLAQQVLAEDTPTRADDIRWGNVVTNGVRVLALDDVLRPDADLLRHSQLHALGEFGCGAADPAALTVMDGKIVVALAGTGEVAFGPKLEGDWPRLSVGRRPLALAQSGRRLFVADAFGDAVAVLDAEKREKIAVISLGPAPEPSAAERGERLFFDAGLSKEGWMSCHSCHGDGHTNGLRADTLGDGSYGAPKRVPTLLGVGATAPWAWNGGITRLEDQVRQSIQTTMHGPKPTEQQIADLTAYLRTLQPPPPLSPFIPPARGGDKGGEDDSARRGEAVFRTRGCVRCHAPPTYTTSKTYEVDLEDEAGNKAFNPPSLRGVGHGVAFLHDGRATRLDEVFARFHHQIPKDVPQREMDDLLAFLRSL
jgi:YVTN family beta-propeller protein